MQYTLLHTILLLMTVVAPGKSDLPELHQWVDSTGQKIEAVFAGREGQNVYLRKTQNGSVIEMPLASLSEKDQKFIGERLADCRVIKGKVIYVPDGDTLQIKESKTEHRIRLGHIDSPEHNQPFGDEAKQALKEKVLNKEVRIVWREKDRYKRILGDVYLDKRFINGEMVKDGNSWHYQKYSKSKALGNFQKKAKEAKRGLWTDSDPTPPWEFRHQKASTSQNTIESSVKPTPESKSVTVYVTRTGSKYHRAGCRYLKSSIPIPLEEAKKRYSPCRACKP